MTGGKDETPNSHGANVGSRVRSTGSRTLPLGQGAGVLSESYGTAGVSRLRIRARSDRADPTLARPPPGLPPCSRMILIASMGPATHRAEIAGELGTAQQTAGRRRFQRASPTQGEGRAESACERVGIRVPGHREKSPRGEPSADWAVRYGDEFQANRDDGRNSRR